MKRTLRGRLTCLFLMVAALGLVPASSTGAQAPGGPVQIPVTVLHGPGGQALVLARVTIHTHRFLFIVDTGASGSLIDRRVARQLRLRAVGRPHRFQGVSCGGRAQPVRVSGWSLGPQLLPARRIDSANLGLGRGTSIAGLLGSDVMSSFGKVTLDFKGSTLTLGG